MKGRDICPGPQLKGFIKGKTSAHSQLCQDSLGICLRCVCQLNITRGAAGEAKIGCGD